MLVSIANRDGQQIVCAPRLARRPRPVVSIWMAMFSLCWTCCTAGSSMEVIKPKDGRCLLLRSCEISCQFGSRVDDLELQRLWARRRAVQLGKWSGLSGAWICWERFQACANPPDPRGIQESSCIHVLCVRHSKCTYTTHISCALWMLAFPIYLPTFVVPMRNCPAAAVVTRFVGSKALSTTPARCHAR